MAKVDCKKCLHDGVCFMQEVCEDLETQLLVFGCNNFAEAVTVGHGEPLTLEELKRMDGCPVWVEVIDHTVFANKADDFDGWGMVRKSWVRLWDEKRADLINVDYHFEDYSKEWRAYRLPVVHGRWENGTCTNCGQVDFSKPNYCPNCGARMDGANDE